MADTPTSSAQDRWASATSHINDLHQQLSSATGNRRALEERLVTIEDYLLDLPAPDLAAVIHKLKLLWAAELHGLDRNSSHKLTILADLRRHAAA